MRSEKPIDVGFQCIRDEAQTIRGWARTMLYFCKRVVALVDPNTADDTVRILVDEFPDIEIKFQDRRLGDSDYHEKGPEGHLIMHGNNTQFVEQEVDVGDWILFLAADERFHPQDFPTLTREIRRAKRENKQALVHRLTFEFLYDNERYVVLPETHLVKYRFFQKPKSGWVQYPGNHAGNSWFPTTSKRVESIVPFYHFPYINQAKFADSWVYGPVYPDEGKLQFAYLDARQLFEWKNMEMIK